MSARPLADHLRRYPWWYGIAAVWIVAMLSLPIVRGGALASVLGGDDTRDGTTTVTGPDGQAAGPSLDPGAPPPSSVDDEPRIDGGVASDDTVPPVDDGADALQLVPPEILDLIFDALPPVVFPALPPEVAPVFNAVAPLAATGCSGLGLAGVVVAVAAQSANGVPIERLLPYLAPASTACASFPIPAKHTVCESDKPFVTDLGGLTTSPPILGLGIDQLRAFEQLMANTFGQSIPSVADSLAVQLNCQLIS
jgi:hypothetical protein